MSINTITYAHTHTNLLIHITALTTSSLTHISSHPLPMSAHPHKPSHSHKHTSPPTYLSQTASNTYACPVHRHPQTVILLYILKCVHTLSHILPHTPLPPLLHKHTASHTTPPHIHPYTQTVSGPQGHFHTCLHTCTHTLINIHIYLLTSSPTHTHTPCHIACAPSHTHIHSHNSSHLSLSPHRFLSHTDTHSLSYPDRHTSLHTYTLTHIFPQH